MKGSKLINWKLALFALGGCVVATPVILSSCGSAIGSGSFVGYDYGIVMNEGLNYCSTINFSIDGNNITHYPSSSYTYDDQTDYFYNGRLNFKFDREYKYKYLVNGKESGWPTDENTEVSISAINYSLRVSDKYITADDAKNYNSYPTYPNTDDYLDEDGNIDWERFEEARAAYIEVYDAWYATLPNRLADIWFVAANGFAISNFCNVDGSTIEANSPITMYITLVKMTSSTKNNVKLSDLGNGNNITSDMYDISYSVYNVIEFTYKRDNSKVVEIY